MTSRRGRLTRVPAVVACALAAMASSGCGAGEETAGAPPPRVPVTVVPVDCTPSVRGDQASWARQIATLAEEVRARREQLLVGCFAGRRAAIDWLPAVDGRATLRTQLRPRRRYGTNWLGALMIASRVDGARRVYLFSDLVQQAEGIDLTRWTSSEELEAVVRAWRPRLSGLRGIEVVSVGAGRGIARPPAARRGEHLLRMLQKDLGFRLRVEVLVGHDGHLDQ